MKKLIFSKLKVSFKSEKMMALLILVGGVAFVIMFSFLRDFIETGALSDNSSVSEEKRILEDQDVPRLSTLNILEEEENACYECGSGSVLGTSREDCDGVKVPAIDNVCDSASFTLSASVQGITESLWVSKDCILSVHEITYPVYWNGHNKFVGGSTDNRYDIHSGEWPYVAGKDSGGAVVNAKDGTPTVAGNNYGAIYEAPGSSVFETNDGSPRAGIDYSLDFVEKTTHKGETQTWYSPQCLQSAPGSTLIGDKGCASPTYSAKTLYPRIISGNEPVPMSVAETVEYLYPDDTASCDDYSDLRVVIGTTERSCIDDHGFLGWGGVWSIFVKATEYCIKMGICTGSTDARVLLNMEEHTSNAGRIKIDARTIPGGGSVRKYVATPCQVKVECSGKIAKAACVWPDYMFAVWQSSELGSSICDPEVNYATVIAEEGEPPIRFNFCEYDGPFGYFSYMQYVTKRCDCVINGSCTEISSDEYKSCQLIIDGQAN